MKHIEGSNQGADAMAFIDKLLALFKSEGSKKGKGTNNPLEVIDNLKDAIKQGNKKLDDLQDMIPGKKDDEIIDSLQQKLGQSSKK